MLAAPPAVDPWSIEIVVTAGDGRSGTERRAISRDAERGVLLRLRSGALVRRDGFESLTPEDQHIVRMRALAEVAGRPVVFSHWSAAILHGLPVLRTRLSALHRTVQNADEGHRRGIASHLFVLSTAEVTRVGPLIATSVARTVVDLAGGSPFEEGVMASDSALAAGVPRAVLEAAVDLAGPRRASSRIDDVIAFGHPGAESAAESQLRVTLFRIGIEVPVLQHRLALRRGSSAYLDAFVRSAEVGIETDGDRKYLDPVLAPGGAGRVVLAEKRREDDVRAQLAGLVRVGWRQSCSVTLLRPMLERAGVLRAKIRPALDDYAAEARAASPRRRPAV